MSIWGTDSVAGGHISVGFDADSNWIGVFGLKVVGLLVVGLYVVDLYVVGISVLEISVVGNPIDGVWVVGLMFDCDCRGGECRKLKPIMALL